MSEKQERNAMVLIERNREIEAAGGMPDELFYFDYTAISDPYVDESGRFPVDPIEHYGVAYLEWLRSL